MVYQARHGNDRTSNLLFHEHLEEYYIKIRFVYQILSYLDMKFNFQVCTGGGMISIKFITGVYFPQVVFTHFSKVRQGNIIFPLFVEINVEQSNYKREAFDYTLRI